MHDVGTVLGVNLPHPARPHEVRRGLGADVAQRLVRYTDVVLQDAEEFRVFLAPLVELDEGEAQPLQVNLGEAAGGAPRRRPTHIRVMGDAAHEADYLPLEENGGKGDQVHHVLPTPVRIIEHNDIAFLELVEPIVLHQGTHGYLEAGEEHRRVVRLGHGVPVSVEDGTGNVFDLLDDGGARSPHQGAAHLIRHLLHGIANHLHGDGIWFVGHGLFLLDCDIGTTYTLVGS